jgi:hypothetical protein
MAGVGCVVGEVRCNLNGEGADQRPDQGIDPKYTVIRGEAGAD